MDRAGYTMGVNIENVVYEVIWHNQMLAPKFRMPETLGGSLSGSLVGSPGTQRITLDINEHLLAEQYDEAKILEEFNEAYGGEMEQEDREFLNQAKDYRRRRFSTRG